MNTANLGAVYGVNLPPQDPANLGPWAYQELNRMANASREARESLKLAILHAEPAKIEEGNLVFADGSDWNPGAGIGFYGRENGSWVKL